ncbi:MAG: hypothetical protein K1X88_14770 [Nannocystaceae bacterium]|nr:hypothetical protein [Nannocystaceae bacterium]
MKFPRASWSVLAVTLAGACGGDDDVGPAPAGMSASTFAISHSGADDLGTGSSTTDGSGSGTSGGSGSGSGSASSGSSSASDSTTGAAPCLDGDVCEVDGVCITIITGTDIENVCTHGNPGDPCAVDENCDSGACVTMVEPGGAVSTCM